MFQQLALLIIFAFNCFAISLVSYQSANIVSDESWTVQGENYIGKAVEALDYDKWYHISGAKWIWKSYNVDDPINGETYMFQKDFYVNGFPSQSLLSIACDDSFVLILNGNYIASRREAKVLTFDLLSKTMQGRNIIQVIVTNLALENATVKDNPAGLCFNLAVKWLNF